MNLKDMSTYVLTEEQALVALLSGAASLGIIPNELVEQALEQIDSGTSAVLVDHLANGMTIRFGAIQEIEEDEIVGPKGSDESGGFEGKTGPAEVKEGPWYSPEETQAALKKVMDRPPGINTIRTWTPAQCGEALRWVDLGGFEDRRPSFIVPRQPRRRRRMDVEDVVVPVVPEPDRNFIKSNGTPDPSDIFMDLADDSDESSAES